MAAAMPSAFAQNCDGNDGVLNSLVINSYPQPYDFDYDDPVQLFDLPYPLFTIQDGPNGFGPAANDVPYDDETKRFIEINLLMIEKSYNAAGEMTKTVNSYPPTECSQSQFRTEYERAFWLENEATTFYCFNNDEIYMQGTKSSSVYFKDHSFLIIEVKRCSGPDCASAAETDEWLKQKKVFMRLINNKIDVSTGEPQLHQYEDWLPTIPLGPNTFTDTGYRYRKNFYSQSGTYMEYFEYTRVFNHDEFVQEDTSEGALIGEFYFRWEDE